MGNGELRELKYAITGLKDELQEIQSLLKEMIELLKDIYHDLPSADYWKEG